MISQKNARALAKSFHGARSTMAGQPNKPAIRSVAVGLAVVSLIIIGLVWYSSNLTSPYQITVEPASVASSGQQINLPENLITQTDQDGRFAFKDLDRATHPVWVDLTSLSENLGRDYKNDIRLIMNPAGQEATSVDGIGLKASYDENGTTITGFAWLDDNNNALIDRGEPPLVGVKVIDPGIRIYYVPFEDTILANTFYDQLDDANCLGGNRILPAQGTRSIISITTGELPATWIYDHYEDGYEADLTNPVQASSQTNNLAAGQSAVFSTEGVGTAAPINTPASPFPYDGRDRVVIIGEPVNFIRIAMAEGVNQGTLGPPVTAMAVGAGQIAEWGTDFRFVWGTDLAATDGNFTIVMPFITAGVNNTTVTIDSDGPGGIAPQQFTLNAGQLLDPSLINNAGSFIGTVESDGTVTADRPIQIIMGAINCTQGGSFGFRATNLQPLNQWSNDYYSPIPSFPNTCRPSNPNRDVLTGYQLHNPGLNPITVNVEGNDTTTIVIPGQSTVLYTATTTQGGIRFYTNNPSDVFYANSGVDIGANNNSGGDFDWGHTLLPATELTSQAVIGWSDGEFATPPNNIYSLAWLTPVTDTTIFVDLNSDGTPDDFDSTGDGVIDAGTSAGVFVAALDLLRISDPTNNSLQGATIYTPNYSQRFALTFGQDPCLAPQGGTAIDLGFTILPLPIVTINKTADLLNDADGNGQVSPGDTVRWNILFENIGRGLMTGAVLTDVVDFLDKSRPCTVDAQGTGTGDCADWVPGSLTSTLPQSNTLYGVTQDPTQINNPPPDSLATEAFRLEWNAIPSRVPVTVTFNTLISTLPPTITQLANTAWICADDVTCTPSDSQVPPFAPSIPITPTPRLNINKFHGINDFPDPVTFGQIFPFTVVLSNTGTITAFNTVITDTLPPQLTYQTGTLGVSFSGNNFISVPDPVQTLPGNRLIFTDSLNLGPGQPVTYTFNVQLSSIGGIGASGIITNLVETEADNLVGQVQNPGVPGDPDLDSTEPIQVLWIDLVIDKDDGGVTTAPGGIVTYTLVFSNVGNTTATGVIITETVPDNTTFIGPAALWSCPAGSPAGTTCTQAIGPMPNGVMSTTTFAVQVNNPVPSGTSAITNTVSIGDDGTNGPDPTPGNNTDTEPTPLPLNPDLMITKVDGGETSISAGQLVTYTLSFTNIGNATATGVVITEMVPVSTTFVGPTAIWSCVPGSPGGTICTTQVGTMTVGASGVLTYIVQIDTPAPPFILNTVCIGDDGASGPDPTPANNCDTVDTPRGASPDMAINKTDNGVITTEGGVIVYTLTYTNIGGTAATGVIITDTVPANTTFNAANSSPGWSCADGSPAGTICSFPLNTVAAGIGGLVTFALNVDNPLPPGVTTIFNTAFIADDGSQGPDPTPENNSSSETTPIPRLEMDKLIDGILIPPSQVAPNQTVTYTVIITNSGGVTFNPVLLTDTLQSGLTFVPGSATPPETGTSGQQIFWADVMSGAGLSPGQSTQITYLVTVTTTPGSYINTAQVEGIYPGGSIPLQDQTTVEVRDPALILSKDVTSLSIADLRVTYTIRITNTGLTTLQQVPLFDIFTADTMQYRGGTPAADSVNNTPPAGVLGWTNLVNTFGQPMLPGQTFVVTTVFEIVTTNTTFTATNQANTVGLDEFNNPTQPASDTTTINIPTSVDLLYFEGQQNNLGVLLGWATAVEYDNFGFRLLRSESGSLADAVEIAFIPGQGHGAHGGADYGYLDQDVLPAKQYTYWLVDVDLSGLETAHAPLTVVTAIGGVPGNAYRLFLPVITR